MSRQTPLTSVLGLRHCVLLVLDEFSVKNRHEPFLVRFCEQRVQHRLEVGTVRVNKAKKKRQFWTWVMVSGRHCAQECKYPINTLSNLTSSKCIQTMTSSFHLISLDILPQFHHKSHSCPRLPCPSSPPVSYLSRPLYSPLSQTKLHVPFSHAPFSPINQLDISFARQHISLDPFPHGVLPSFCHHLHITETDSLLPGHSVSSGGVKNKGLTRTMQQRSCWRSGSPRMSSSCHPGYSP